MPRISLRFIQATTAYDKQLIGGERSAARRWADGVSISCGLAEAGHSRDQGGGQAAYFSGHRSLARASPPALNGEETAERKIVDSAKLGGSVMNFSEHAPESGSASILEGEDIPVHSIKAPS